MLGGLAKKVQRLGPGLLPGRPCSGKDSQSSEAVSEGPWMDFPGDQRAGSDALCQIPCVPHLKEFRMVSSWSMYSHLSFPGA